MARIVFDLDGTLIDSAPDICGIANALMAEEGLEPITLEQARGFVGMGAAVFVTRLRNARDIPDAEQERLLAAFKGRYNDAVELTVPYPGVEGALRALRDAGHRLGICTNKPISPSRAVLKHLSLDQYFETVWGGDSLPQHKPDPSPLHAAFDALGDGDKIYVGDSEVDAQTAQSASVPFFLFTEGYRKAPLSELPHTAHFSQYDAFLNLVQEFLAKNAA